MSGSGASARLSGVAFRGRMEKMGDYASTVSSASVETESVMIDTGPPFRSYNPVLFESA